MRQNKPLRKSVNSTANIKQLEDTPKRSMNRAYSQKQINQEQQYLPPNKSFS